jgi:RNA recognition motif-containing protein
MLSAPPSQTSRTVYVGDLSVYCTEDEICRLFSPFGTIESVSLKKVNEGTNYYLAYGFIKFGTPQSAEASIQALNGILFLGRPLR